MRTIALVALLAILASAPVHASNCVPSTSSPEADTRDLLAERYYFDYDFCQQDCMDAFWIYQESNGIDGLQRQDDREDDTCGGQIRSDTIIF